MILWSSASVMKRLFTGDFNYVSVLPTLNLGRNLGVGFLNKYLSIVFKWQYIHRCFQPPLLCVCVYVFYALLESPAFILI